MFKEFKNLQTESEKVPFNTGLKSGHLESIKYDYLGSDIDTEKDNKRLIFEFEGEEEGVIRSYRHVILPVNEAITRKRIVGIIGKPSKISIKAIGLKKGEPQTEEILILQDYYNFIIRLKHICTKFISEDEFNSCLCDEQKGDEGKDIKENTYAKLASALFEKLKHLNEAPTNKKNCNFLIEYNWNGKYKQFPERPPFIAVEAGGKIKLQQRLDKRDIKLETEDKNINSLLNKQPSGNDDVKNTAKNWM